MYEEHIQDLVLTVNAQILCLQFAGIMVTLMSILAKQLVIELWSPMKELVDMFSFKKRFQ